VTRWPTYRLWLSAIFRVSSAVWIYDADESPNVISARSKDRNPVDSIDAVKKVDKPVEILKVAELARLLDCATPEVLPLIAIGAFAGVRTAELLRLDWKDADLTRGFLNVDAEKSKSARRRLIKMEPCLIAWLSPYAGKTGLILPVNVFQYLHLVRQTCKAAGITAWPKNGLRHSFASYHLAKHQDAPRLALDMGHVSPHMIFNHYREIVTPEEAERYWQIFPPQPAQNVVPMQAS
jgi:integrase